MVNKIPKKKNQKTYNWKIEIEIEIATQVENSVICWHLALSC